MYPLEWLLQGTIESCDITIFTSIMIMMVNRSGRYVHVRQVLLVGNMVDVGLMKHLVTVRNVITAHDDHQRIIVEDIDVIIDRVVCKSWGWNWVQNLIRYQT